MAQIDIEKLAQIKVDADKIFISAEGEQVLVDLLTIQQQVEEAIEAAKLKLEETGKKLNPDFSSIQGDRVKVYYRQYGGKYKLDESLLEYIPAKLYTTKTTYTPDTKAIDEYIDEHKGLPQGILTPERTKSLSFSLKKGATDDKEK
jgi:hypothetical protein